MRKPINMMAEAIIVAQDNADYYAKMVYELMEGNDIDYVNVYEKLNADGYTNEYDEWAEDDPSTIEYLVGDAH